MSWIPLMLYLHIMYIILLFWISMTWTLLQNILEYMLMFTGRTDKSCLGHMAEDPDLMCGKQVRSWGVPFCCSHFMQHWLFREISNAIELYELMKGSFTKISPFFTCTGLDSWSMRSCAIFLVSANRANCWRAIPSSSRLMMQYLSSTRPLWSCEMPK